MTEASPALTLLSLRGVSKSFPGVRALDEVSFEVLAGEVHALMGENGAGKSTLTKILAGAYQADSGEILLEGTPVINDSPQRAIDRGINVIYQELNLVPHLSVAENIFLGREPGGRFPGFVDLRKMRDDARLVMESLGASIDVRLPVYRLSVAQQQMVEIARAASRSSKLIIMDEPSATLTAHELENLWSLIRRLKNDGVSIIYISHRMEEVFAIADRVTVLRDGHTVATRAIQDVTREELVNLMVGRKLSETFPKIEAEKGPPILEVRNLSRKGVLHDISLFVHAGEIVALAGLVGSGRTEIARCIFGADPFDSGSLLLAGKPVAIRSPRDAIAAGIALITEDRKQQGLVLGMNVRENTTLAALGSVSHFGLIRGAQERAVAREYVSSLSIRTPTTERRVSSLSGGNQQKVVLAKWLLTKSRLLIMDEPTRGIDVGAKVEIYNLMNELVARGAGILMISSELPEVLGMADRIVVIREGRVAGVLPRAEATQEAVGRLAVGV